MGQRNPVSGEVLAQISREIVRLKAQSYGKGATEAKTYLCDNFVFSVLKGGLTTAEHTLVEHGDADLVRQVRLRYQSRLADQYCGIVERLTGRQILTYDSQIVFDPDYTIETFVLAPEGVVAHAGEYLPTTGEPGDGVEEDATRGLGEPDVTVADDGAEVDTGTGA